MKIKKYICEAHNLITTRKGLRKHIGERHARNLYKSSGAWKVEEWKEPQEVQVVQ